MVKKSRKSAVPPEVARQWLKRYEEGETPPAIATKDSYDPRTVRKVLETVRQEREIREVRGIVLRQALEHHYADLCTFAESLKTELDGPWSAGDIPLSISLKYNPLWTALQEHLPGPGLARELRRWEDVAEEVQSSLSSLKARVEKEAAEITSLNIIVPINEIGVLGGLYDAISFQAVSQGEGKPGLESMKYTEGSSELEGSVIIRLGHQYNLACVPQDQRQEVQQSLESLIKQAGDWEETVELSKQIAKAEIIRRDLVNKLIGITLRRVLPGKCQYCPF